MLTYLQRLSGFFFYVLGLTFFLSYLLVRNELGGFWPAWWLQVTDLPLIFTTMVYGGLSVYISVRSQAASTKVIGWVIAALLLMFFVLLAVMNFWK